MARDQSPSKYRPRSSCSPMRKFLVFVIVSVTAYYAFMAMQESASTPSQIVQAGNLPSDEGIAKKAASSDGSDTTKTSTTINNKVIETPAVSQLQRRTFAEVDTLYQLPANQMKGILWLGHGCSHQGSDFFVATPGICDECLGLPEERAIVALALEQYQFAVVAMSSQDRNTKCWKTMDGTRVANAMKDFLQTIEGSAQLPLIAFGASSGGNFVGSHLLDEMEDIERPLDGFIAQIAAPDPRSHQVDAQHYLPVATYITMNRDRRTDRLAQEIVSSMNDQNHPALQIQLDPVPLTPDFFSNRIPEVTLEQSQAMVQALKDAHYMDESSLLLTHDPRVQRVWAKKVKEFAPPTDSLKPDESPISEVMNVARGMHEMSRDGVAKAMDFILKIHQQREQENAIKRNKNINHNRRQ